MISRPQRWGEGWGMDSAGIPFLLVGEMWVEQAPIGQTLRTPRRFPL